jgi:hypothetical protein
MKTIAFLLLFSISLAANAQQSKNQRTVYSILGFGAGLQKWDGLNSRIAQFPQYEQVKDYTALLHLGWLKEYKRFISGPNFMLGSTMTGDRDEKSSTMRFFGIGADFGYDVIASDKLMLYPLVGLGGEFYQARFYKDNSNVDFDDVLQSPTVQNSVRALGLKNTFVTYKVGVGFNVKSSGNKGAIGLQASYNGSFQDKAWKSNDGQALGSSPEDRLSRFQLSIIFSGIANGMMNHSK